MNRNDQAWAVFRCQLLAPLLLDDIPASERGAYFRQLSQQEHLLPNGTRTTISVRTLRRWWKRLREEGVEAMQRQPRSDRGLPHRQAERGKLFQRALQLKKEQPLRSAHVINKILLHEFSRKLPPSTLYRHLRRHGATRQKLGITDTKIRCRWTRDHANALWVGDFEHGPMIVEQGHAVKTYLSAWIDCHSRYIVEARYYTRENFDVLVDSLLRAWGHHGTSQELYVDNAKIYHADALKLACAKLNIRLRHRPPREPEPGGLIERFFQTLQFQFEAEARAASMLTLNQLNRVLQAWLQTDYHQRVHSQTGETPQARYDAGTTAKRCIDLSRVNTFFHQRVERTVDRDHADVRIDNQFFQVDPSLRGDRVVVIYDPFLVDDDLREVTIHDERGVYVGVGKLYQRERGAHEQPPQAPTNQGPIEPHYFHALDAQQQAAHEASRQDGLDFYSATKRNVWSLSGWTNAFARLLGRQGGMSGFTADELTALQAFHEKHDRVTEPLLGQAVARAEEKSIPQILWHLQDLLQETKE